MAYAMIYKVSTDRTAINRYSLLSKPSRFDEVIDGGST